MDGCRVGMDIGVDKATDIGNNIDIKMAIYSFVDLYSIAVSMVVERVS